MVVNILLVTTSKNSVVDSVSSAVVDGDVCSSVDGSIVVAKELKMYVN